MSAAVAVGSSHMTASSSASWSRFDQPSNFVNGHVSTTWFMVCHWPQSQECDWARPHLCKLVRHGPWPVWKWFIRHHIWQGRSKPGSRIVGSVTTVWLTTQADDQSSLHCIIVTTDVMSDHIGRQDASHGGGCLKTSAYAGEFVMQVENTCHNLGLSSSDGTMVWLWCTWLITKDSKAAISTKHQPLLSAKPD